MASSSGDGNMTVEDIKGRIAFLRGEKKRLTEEFESVTKPMTAEINLLVKQKQQMEAQAKATAKPKAKGKSKAKVSVLETLSIDELQTAEQIRDALDAKNKQFQDRLRELSKDHKQADILDNIQRTVVDNPYGREAIKDELDYFDKKIAVAESMAKKGMTITTKTVNSEMLKQKEIEKLLAKQTEDMKLVDMLKQLTYNPDPSIAEEPPLPPPEDEEEAKKAKEKKKAAKKHWKMMIPGIHVDSDLDEAKEEQEQEQCVSTSGSLRFIAI